MRYCPPIYVLRVSSHLWTVPRQIKFWAILIKSWDWRDPPPPSLGQNPKFAQKKFWTAPLRLPSDQLYEREPKVDWDQLAAGWLWPRGKKSGIGKDNTIFRVQNISSDTDIKLLLWFYQDCNKRKKGNLDHDITWVKVCLPVGPRCGECLNRQLCPTGRNWQARWNPSKILS